MKKIKIIFSMLLIVLSCTSAIAFSGPQDTVKKFCYTSHENDYYVSLAIDDNACRIEVKNEHQINDSLQEVHCRDEQLHIQDKNTIQAKDNRERFYERDRNEQVIKAEKALKNNNVWRIVAGCAVFIAIIEIIKR